ncbi:MAG: hypothetical protein HQL32_02040 [Planctomycetes bacterium]|nr:hypothetical protein [Planctomycetota bacterium]
MDLDELDRLIQDRESRIDKRKDEGTLFQDENKKAGNQDEQLSREVQSQKEKMDEQLQAKIPPCPQCNQKMTYSPEQSMILCHDCGVGMRV